MPLIPFLYGALSDDGEEDLSAGDRVLRGLDTALWASPRAEVAGLVWEGMGFEPIEICGGLGCSDPLLDPGYTAASRTEVAPRTCTSNPRSAFCTRRPESTDDDSWFVDYMNSDIPTKAQIQQTRNDGRCDERESSRHEIN